MPLVFSRIPRPVVYGISLILLLLAGCAYERLRAGKTVKLVAWGFTFGEETRGLAAHLKAFGEQHPEVTVSILSMGAGTMKPRKLMTSVVGSVSPGECVVSVPDHRRTTVC